MSVLGWGLRSAFGPHWSCLRSPIGSVSALSVSVGLCPLDWLEFLCHVLLVWTVALFRMSGVRLGLFLWLEVVQSLCRVRVFRSAICCSSRVHPPPCILLWPIRLPVSCQDAFCLWWDNWGFFYLYLPPSTSVLLLVVRLLRASGVGCCVRSVVVGSVGWMSLLRLWCLGPLFVGAACQVVHPLGILALSLSLDT